jgi:hypothetical protein
MTLATVLCNQTLQTARTAWSTEASREFHIDASPEVVFEVISSQAAAHQADRRAIQRNQQH